MTFGDKILKLRKVLSPQDALELATAHLAGANKAKNPDMALTFCYEAQEALSRIRRSVRKKLVSSLRPEDQDLRNKIAAAHCELRELFDSYGHKTRGMYNHWKSQSKWGGLVRKDEPSFHDGSDTWSLINISDCMTDSTDEFSTDTIVSCPVSVPSPRSDVSRPRTLSSPLPPLPSPAANECSAYDISPTPAHIFARNMQQPANINKLPRVQERLESVSQLVYCLELLRWVQSSADPLDQAEIQWLYAIGHVSGEKERLQILATNLIREFLREELKDAKALAEVVRLVPVLDKGEFRQLLYHIFHGIEKSQLINFDLLEGLAQLVKRVPLGYIDADDLVKILELINLRLANTHKQSQTCINQLTQTVSHVLDAMVDSDVKGLDHENLRTPLADYLSALENEADPRLVYLAAYASQALLYVPDDEKLWKATMRRTGKVVKGVAGLVSAVKGLDLVRLVESLGHIQDGVAGASNVLKIAKIAYKDFSGLAKSGMQFRDCLKEGCSFTRKRIWYPALRAAGVFLRNGQLTEFETLVREAPCQLDPAFQWGICQQLGELAANTKCDNDSRTGAVAFLGEIYRNDVVWGSQAIIKQWILDILIQVASLSGSVMTASETLLHELKKDGDAKKQTFHRACRKKGLDPHLFKFSLPLLSSSSLLDRVQNKVHVDDNLLQLKERQLQRGIESIYISPQAKSSLRVRNGELFPLMSRVKEFLSSDQKVFLLLGDSGAGKSTFNVQLECDLWESYKKPTDRIPLFITLAMIQNPEKELIAEQLRKEGFTESQIQELKTHREFILICDGYDESRQTSNLYTSNQLNRPGGWRVQMVISCRSEYLGLDYRDKFQPVDRNHQADQTLFQEAVITPFTKDQIRDYIKQFVDEKDRPWKVSEYIEAIDRIPNLKDLVTNPFLLTLSLDVLPEMVGLGSNLPATSVTRVALYDKFMEKWLRRSEIRLFENGIKQDRKAINRLSNTGFAERAIKFLKDFATAIFDNQAGNSVVEYTFTRDKGTWKETFFGEEDEKKILREACPLNRNGNQYRFIHRSLLEYSLACAVFEQQDKTGDGKWKVESATTSARRESSSSNASSNYCPEGHGNSAEVVVAIEQSVLDSPLGRSNFVNEPSILRFLVERVQQEPLFKKQLLAIIERSKTKRKDIKAVRLAAANAITILVRAGVQFNGADLRGIQIPGADLSHGVFDSAQLQGANMKNVVLRSAWLRGANLDGARMRGVQFGELPYLRQESSVESCAYSPDGNKLAVGLSNSEISVYKTQTWERVGILHGHYLRVESVAFSPCSGQIVSGSEDRTVRLWDVDTRVCRHTFIGHGDQVSSVAYSPLGDQVASGSEDKTVRLWDVETGDCLHTLHGHSDRVSSVAYSPSGDEIASGSYDNTIRLWDIKTGHRLRTLSDHSQCVSSVGYSPSGDKIVSSSYRETVELWDAKTGAFLSDLSGHGDSVRSASYSPKGDHIASGCDDKTVRLWDVGTRDCRHILRGHSRSVTSVVYSPSGNQVASGSDDCTVRLWDIETEDNHYSLCRSHSGHVSSVVWSPKGDQIASGSVDRTVRLWDFGTGDCHHTLKLHSDWNSSVAYSPKGGQIASSGSDNTVELWDIVTGECNQTLRGHSGSVLSIAYSPRGHHIASGSYDNTVRLWNVETGENVQTFKGHRGSVSSVAYAPKGRQIASGSKDKTIRLWDIGTGNMPKILTGHTGSVRSVVYSPKDDQVASCSDDKTVRLWDSRTGECLQILLDHNDSVRSITYSPKGDKIVSGSSDSTGRLWDVASGQCLAVIRNHAEVYSVAWKVISKHNYLAVGCSDGSVLLWQVMDERGKYSVRLHWRSLPDELKLMEASMKDVTGLTLLNKQLVEQRGAVDELVPS